MPGSDRGVRGRDDLQRAPHRALHALLPGHRPLPRGAHTLTAVQATLALRWPASPDHWSVEQWFLFIGRQKTIDFLNGWQNTNKAFLISLQNTVLFTER